MHVAEPAQFRRSGSGVPQPRRDGHQRAGRQLRRRQRCGPSHRARRDAWGTNVVDPPSGQQREPGSAARAARAPDPRRPVEPVRLRRRPRPRQGDDLPLRRREAPTDSGDARVGAALARCRSAPHGVQRVGPVRLRDQRAELHDHGVPPRSAQRCARRSSRRCRRCRRAWRRSAASAPPRSPLRRRARFSTARTAATTASACSRSTSRRAN